MAPAGFFVDANLLVLFVVGSTGRELIAKHRRLKEYRAADYEALIRLLLRGRDGRVFVTPNTLTETSNLLGQHKEPERSRLFEKLRVLIQESKEVVVAYMGVAPN